jgi:hypothetical protein
MMPERRVFILNTIRSLGLATAEGLGWSGFIEEGKDEERVTDVSEEVTTETPRSSRKPEDYLNQDIEL